MAYEVIGKKRVVIYPTGDQQAMIRLFIELTGVPEQIASEFIVRVGMEAILMDPAILGVTAEQENKIRSLRDMFRMMGGVGI